MSFHSPTIVLDNGSGMCKVGFAGDDAPLSVFPSIIGHPKHKGLMVGTGGRSTFVGSEVQAKRGILYIEYPIKHGMITDWNATQQILSHAFFNELCIAPEEYRILLSEPPMNPLVNRQRMSQILFETFNMIGMQALLSGILTLHSSAGRVTGLVCDSGDTVSYVMPIYEGYLIPHAIQRLDYAGRDLTQILMNMLSVRGYSLTTNSEREIVRDMKEKLSYLALDFDKEISSGFSTESEYQLPDGQVILIGNEKFRCCEPLFKPKLFGIDSIAIDKAIYNSIMNCSVDIRKDLLSNITLAGGTTTLPMFPERLKKELTSLHQSSNRIKIVSFPKRQYSVWIGGSIIASLSTFQNSFVTRAQYEEHGPNIFYRKYISNQYNNELYS